MSGLVADKSTEYNPTTPATNPRFKLTEIEARKAKRKRHVPGYAICCGSSLRVSHMTLLK